MAIKGSLKEASLPDVLQLLALGQKTGCLSIADRQNFGYIYFEKGRICYASIVNRRDRLGDILVKHEKITQEQLDDAIAAQGKVRDKKLGEILVQQTAISQPELERYMRIQIEESVYYLFTWTQGTFNFETDVQPERQDFLVSINPESLLLEGARRVDEWSLIEKKIPSFDVIFIVDRDHLAISEVTLTVTQQRLLPLIDGERDIHRLVEDSGLGEFEVGKALYGLLTAGFLHRAGRTAAAAPEEAKVPDARVEEHRNLGVAFYKTGMLDEATREFRRVSELRPGDANALFFIGLVALKQARWREAMEALRLAAEKGGSRPAVLHNLGLAYEHLGRLDEAEAAYADAAARNRNDARIALGWGIVALKRGDHDGAAGRLDRAKELFGDRIPAAWYWARTLVAAAGGDFEVADELAEAGVVAFPESAVLRNNRAVLRELAGDLVGAEELVRAALRDEPSQPQLSKNLGDLAYRAGRYDEAWAAYQRAIDLAPDLGDDIYFKLGNIAYKRTDRDLAAQMWRRALELNPTHELVKSNLETLSALT
jgi:tetratricopeptide (TPR) repeat protein